MEDVLGTLAEQIPAAVAVGTIVSLFSIAVIKAIIKPFAEAMSDHTKGLAANTQAISDLSEALEIAEKLDLILTEVKRNE